MDLKKEYVSQFVKKISGMAEQAGFKVSLETPILNQETILTLADVT